MNGLRVKIEKLRFSGVRWLQSGANKPSESHLQVCRNSPIVGDARLLVLGRKSNQDQDRKESIQNILQIYLEKN